MSCISVFKMGTQNHWRVHVMAACMYTQHSQHNTHMYMYTQHSQHNTHMYMYTQHITNMHTHICTHTTHHTYVYVHTTHHTYMYANTQRYSLNNTFHVRKTGAYITPINAHLQASWLAPPSSGPSHHDTSTPLNS